MKAIILAAGKGTRLKHYTENLPKGMLSVFGKSIIEHQIGTYRACGINDIIVIRGFMGEKINFPGIKYYTNEKFDSTNMVESLFCAKAEFNDDIIVSYADILFEKRIIQELINEKSDIVVTVDMDWKDYWKKRYGKIDTDTESLRIDKAGNITELGKSNPTINEIDARYVGLLKFSKKGPEIIKKEYAKLKHQYSNKIWKETRTFEQAYMTDFLQSLIDSNIQVKAMKIHHGWLEFDTVEDYELIVNMHKNKQLEPLFFY